MFHTSLEKVCSHMFPLIFQPMPTLETTTFKLRRALGEGLPLYIKYVQVDSLKQLNR